MKRFFAIALVLFAVNSCADMDESVSSENALRSPLPSKLQYIHKISFLPGGNGCVEVCNGMDDNGNGLIDESDPNEGVICDTQMVIDDNVVHVQGTLLCVLGALNCAPPVLEECQQMEEIQANGMDDNCNGQVDEVVGNECTVNEDCEFDWMYANDYCHNGFCYMHLLYTQSSFPQGVTRFCESDGDCPKMSFCFQSSSGNEYAAALTGKCDLEWGICEKPESHQQCSSKCQCITGCSKGMCNPMVLHSICTVDLPE